MGGIRAIGDTVESDSAASMISSVNSAAQIRSAHLQAIHLEHHYLSVRHQQQRLSQQETRQNDERDKLMKWVIL